MPTNIPAKELARQNRLLASLPESELETIASHLTPVDLDAGEELHAPEAAIDYAYFPTTAVLSMLATLENGDITEVAVTGNEGVSGVSGFLGKGTQPTRVVAQVAGNALRVPMRMVHERFEECGDFQTVLLRYAQYLLAQLMQTAACNRLHSVDQQFGRWLLINDDTHPGDELRMTHELLSQMLGCSRVSISKTAKNFEKRGWITYTRGIIKITNRPGIEAAVCECYAATMREYNRIFER